MVASRSHEEDDFIGIGVGREDGGDDSDIRKMTFEQIARDEKEC